MAWGKAGSSTLSSTGSTSSTSITGTSKLVVVLENYFPTTAISPRPRVGYSSLDSTANYATRGSYAGTTASDYTSTSGTYVEDQLGGATFPVFSVGYWVNIATEEKLFIGFSVYQATSGSGTDPRRREIAGKWCDTTNQFNIIGNELPSGSFYSNTNISALGSDLTPALEEVTLQDGTIFEETDTNKAYIWNASTTTWTQL